MGGILKGIGSIFGGSGSKGDPSAEDAVKSDQSVTQGQRAALFETDGGVAGDELQPNNIQQRPNLFGN